MRQLNAVRAEGRGARAQTKTGTAARAPGRCCRGAGARLGARVAAGLLGLPGVASAQAAGGGADSAGLPLAQVAGGLVAVLVLVLVLAWALRMVMQVRPAAHGQMRIVGGLSMGPRERVVLVDVGGTQLVLGVAPGRIQTLHVLDEPVAEAPRQGLGQSPFAQQLAAVLGRREGGR